MAFGYYKFQDFNAVVHIDESMSWTQNGGDGQIDLNSATWTVSMYPGETKVVVIRFSNKASIDTEIEVYPTVYGPSSGDPFIHTSNGIVPAKGFLDIPIVASASTSIPPGDYSFTFAYHRGSLP